MSLLVGLVSIQSIGQFFPSLVRPSLFHQTGFSILVPILSIQKSYLDRHQFQEEVIQSLVPTLLVALLTLLIPLLLLLIAKKAQTISTLSVLHDRIMTRYYKFLIVNVLVFFCVGTAAVQTILQSFKKVLGDDSILKITATSFPTAGPFYVGWCEFGLVVQLMCIAKWFPVIFTTALHGGLELALLGVRIHNLS